MVPELGAGQCVDRLQDGLVGLERMSFPIPPEGEPRASAWSNQGFTTLLGDEAVSDAASRKRVISPFASSSDPPLSDALLLVARYHLHAGDLRRAILEAAIACEEALTAEVHRLWDARATRTQFEIGRVLRCDEPGERFGDDLSRFVVRSLLDELPEVYADAEQLRLSRHSAAHTASASIAAEGTLVPVTEGDAKALVGAAARAVEWLWALI